MNKVLIDRIGSLLISIRAMWRKLASYPTAKIRSTMTVWRTSEPFRKTLTYTGTAAAVLAVLLIYIQYLAPAIFEGTVRLVPAGGHAFKSPDSIQVVALQKQIALQTAEFKKKLSRFSFSSPYMVINSTKNEFELYSGGQLIRQGICSTGSYVKLEQDDQKQWIFRTPKGMFRIRGKNKFPVWKKPDWAFVEEGKAVPSANHPSRFEYGVLGDYSLSLGDGYLIHGTLYQRMLGMPVTHGCVRLGDEDLEAVFRALNSGDRVFIY